MTEKIYYEGKGKIYDRLVETDSDYQIFSRYADLFLLAACIGYKELREAKISDKIDSWGEIDDEKGELNWNVFKKYDSNIAVINAIALAETSDLNLLLNTEKEVDKKIEILVKYANCGIQIIKEKVLDMPGDPLDNLITYVFGEMEKVKKIEVLKEIENELYE
jgi:dnd system-associated protein 4